MRLILFCIILLTCSFAKAQQTYVPDDNFEAYLEANAMGNGIPGDDYVTTANISGVSSLIVWGNNIADLTGIEDFSSLSMLFCFDNQLTSLDVTQNTSLNDLRCYNNQLSALDVSQNTSLSTLLCNNNQLLSLDVTQNSFLSDLRCFNNSLTSLDVTQNQSLSLLICNNNIIGSLDVSQNPWLTDFRCYNNQISSLDVSQNTILTTLFCYNNQLTSLDVSQNTSLVSLFCYNNQLSSLNVAQTASMTDLRCYSNQLSSLDVSQSTSLATIFCNNNLLTMLDVNQNTALTYLGCQSNQLVCLKANNGQNINMDCSNNMLSCISVVYPPWAYANIIYDAGVTFEVLCQYNVDNDINQNATSLTAVQNNATYQWLNCDSNYIAMDELNQSFSPLVTGFFAVEITYTDPCGGVHVDTSSCHFHYVEEEVTSLDELSNSSAELIKITDLMGRETEDKANTLLIYIYSDGEARRVFRLE